MTPAIHEELLLGCLGCGHKFTRLCPVIAEEIIIEDDVCPMCGEQAEPD